MDLLKVDLTITMQNTISATSEEDYEKKRDEFIAFLEKGGWSVNVEAEETV